MTPPAKDRRASSERWLWRLVAAAISAVCLGLLLSKVTVAEFVRALGEIEPGYAAAGFGVVVLSYLLKTARFRILLGAGASFGRLFGITVAQNVAAQMLPARAGDVGYVFLVRKARMASVGYAIATLLMCRLVDLLVVVVMYLVSLGVLMPTLPVFRQVAWAVGAVTCAILVIAMALLAARGRAVAFVGAALEKSRLIRLRGVAYIWRELLDALPHVGKLGLVRHVLPIVFSSVLIWTCTAAWVWLIWRAVEVRLGPAQLLFIFSFTHILSLLPIFLFGGVGTGDAVNATVLRSFGQRWSQAAAFSLCNRALTLIYLVLLGVLAAVSLAARPRAEKRLDGGG